MARPKKVGLDYFSHDVDLSGDEKIEALEAAHGLEGYAVYLKLVERVFREGTKLFVNKDMLAVFARKCGITEQRLDDILVKIFDLELFEREKFYSEKILTSNGIRKRHREVQRNRLKWRKNKERFSIEKTRRKQVENTTKERKVKESKVKESKEEIHIPDWVPKEPWAGFVEMRKKSRTPFTDRAKKLALTELEKLKNKGYESGAVLNQSVMNGWKGLFAVKDGGGNGRGTRADGAASGKNSAGGVKPEYDKYAGVTKTYDEDS